MDWNKWINQGVGYIDIKTSKKYFKDAQTINKDNNIDFKFKNPEDKENADKILEKIK